MTIFVFSDVHGDFSALLSSLERAGFESENENHVLLSLGDDLDRGSENKQVLDFLMSYWRKNRLMHIKGNHCQMLLDFINGVDDGVFNAVHNGMFYTLDNLSGLDSRRYIYDYPQLIIDKILENYPDIIKFYDDTKDSFDIGRYNFTHGGYTNVNKYEEWKKGIWEIDNWSNTENFIRFFEKSPQYDPEKIYVFGHWHAYKLRDMFIGKSINPDTGGFVRNHHTFIYKNYIGLDACTNLSGFVNVLVIETNARF
jgi:serine/threonine protein phosphatase 1